MVPARLLDQLCSLTRNELKVYLALASFRNTKSNRIYPSYATLATRAGISKSRIAQALKSLQSKGLIDRAAGRRGRCNHYQLIIPTPMQALPPEAESLQSAGQTDPIDQTDQVDSQELASADDDADPDYSPEGEESVGQSGEYLFTRRAQILELLDRPLSLKQAEAIVPRLCVGAGHVGQSAAKHVGEGEWSAMELMNLACEVRFSKDLKNPCGIFVHRLKDNSRADTANMYTGFICPVDALDAIFKVLVPQLEGKSLHLEQFARYINVPLPLREGELPTFKQFPPYGAPEEVPTKRIGSALCHVCLELGLADWPVEDDEPEVDEKSWPISSHIPPEILRCLRQPGPSP